MIPKQEAQIKYIDEVLEEDERENFFKMKMVSNKKAQEIEEAGIQEIEEARKTGLISKIGAPGHTGAVDAAEDDVLF